MNEENQISYYAVIPATIRYDTRLKAAEKLMYGEIISLTNRMGYCFPNNKYFANLYNVTIHTVSQWISYLEKLGYIAIELIRDNKKQIKERRIYIRDSLYVQKNTYPYVLKSTYHMYKNVQDNNINIKIDRKIKLNKLSRDKLIGIYNKCKQKEDAGIYIDCAKIALNNLSHSANDISAKDLIGQVDVILKIYDERQIILKANKLQ